MSYRSFRQFIDQCYGGSAGFRIKIGLWLIEKQHLYIVNQHTRQRDSLLLSPGHMLRTLGEKSLHIDHTGHVGYQSSHILLIHALVFQGKGDIFGYTEGDELGIGVLHHRPDLLVDSIDVGLFDIQAAYKNAALHRPAESVGDEGVDAVPKRTFSTAGRTGDQDFLPFADP